MYSSLVVNVVDKPNVRLSKTKPKVDFDSDKPEIKFNFKKLFAVTAIAESYAIQKVGQYTGNKFRQTQLKTLFSLASIGTTTMMNPALGFSVIASATIKRTIDMEIEELNSKQESNFRTSYLGKPTTSGSRWRGGM